MATVKEIIEIESQRNLDTEYNEIHLFVEGSFFRAYEWSAWLCCKYLNDFKVLHRQFKGIDESVIYVGFPKSSLSKWRKDNIEEIQVAEKHLKLVLPEFLFQDVTDDVQSLFSEWKTSCPLTIRNEPLKGDTETESHVVQPSKQNGIGIIGVMQQILSFPIEEKSQMECVSFLVSVRRQLLSLL